MLRPSRLQQTSSSPLPISKQEGDASRARLPVSAADAASTTANMQAVWVMLICLAATPGASASTCKGVAAIPGLPGVPGRPGSNGRDGENGHKGERGPPGQTEDQAELGEKGDAGLPGFPGKVGPKGPAGSRGAPGPRGALGRKGESGDYKTSLKSAFSASRTINMLPRRDQPIRFDRVITNENGHYENRYGRFTCKIPGLYYFTYHATSRGNLCVNIKKGKGNRGEKVVTFCDYVHNTYQVTTGGVVLKVKADESIWLEPTEKNSLVGIEGADSIFSGFLLFPDN
ncbi:complement C1q subcomponent subunit B isoform X2 [Alligator sinensis]|uniref:Complement C1q subcomponent subunit B isoform X2 n=1 Tax=Alligator sinensis TaxID=38654 RepID=A0A1U7S031_ALLSI|nr:complement C1q subcomponent subunit B isoform X2 [Alligator sinensis]